MSIILNDLLYSSCKTLKRESNDESTLILETRILSFTRIKKINMIVNTFLTSH